MEEPVAFADEWADQLGRLPCLGVGGQVGDEVVEVDAQDSGDRPGLVLGDDLSRDLDLVRMAMISLGGGQAQGEPRMARLPKAAAMTLQMAVNPFPGLSLNSLSTCWAKSDITA